VALHVDASIGLALCPDHADTATALLQRADVAMYQAKAGHHGWQTYAFVGQHQARDRLQTIEDLRAALAGDELVLHYQPKIDPRTRRVVAVEALVRWAHPTHGLLYPDTFLPLAEQTGLMRQLTLVVLQTALRQGQAWRRDGLDLPVAVNLSVANLLDAHLARQVSDLLAVRVRGVVDAADGWVAAEGGVSAVMVVQMQPFVQGGGAFLVAGIGA
jgi:predicted signal transduction protein with EAL and GGDEF domain